MRYFDIQLFSTYYSFFFYDSFQCHEIESFQWNSRIQQQFMMTSFSFVLDRINSQFQINNSLIRLLETLKTELKEKKTNKLMNNKIKTIRQFKIWTVIIYPSIQNIQWMCFGYLCVYILLNHSLFICSSFSCISISHIFIRIFHIIEWKKTCTQL